MSWRRALVLAVLAFLLIWAGRAAVMVAQREFASSAGEDVSFDTQRNVFESARRNYMGSKAGGYAYEAAKPDATPALVGASDQVKFERVATLVERTTAFDETRTKFDEMTARFGGVVQMEKRQGLAGRRSAALSVGVPAERFDAFVEEARKLADLRSFSVEKKDRTKEYRELGAKRAALIDARDKLAGLDLAGASVADRLAVHAERTKVERELKELGAEMGDFDSANEFCTVNLTLYERGASKANVWRTVLSVAGQSFFWSLWLYAGLAGALAAFSIGLLILTLAASAAQRLIGQNAQG